MEGQKVGCCKGSRKKCLTVTVRHFLQVITPSARMVPVAGILHPFLPVPAASKTIRRSPLFKVQLLKINARDAPACVFHCSFIMARMLLSASVLAAHIFRHNQTI